MAPAPTSITLRPGAGTDRSDRTTIIWADGAISNQWLQVTVKATPATGLAADDVFYFGNAIADSGNTDDDAQVNLADEIAARNNPRTGFNPATLDLAFDYNRDQFVNLADEIIARNNGTTVFTALKLITVSGALLASGPLARAAVETPPVLTIQKRGTAVWIVCRGSAQVTPVLMTTVDLAHGLWISVSTPPTYNSDNSSWTWRLDPSVQTTQAFYRLAGQAIEGEKLNTSTESDYERPHLNSTGTP